MHALRARIKNDIVCEFLVPKRHNGKVVIVASGAPSYPKIAVLQKLVNAGYFCIMPRYRGSWESDGLFLKHSPHLDIIHTIEQIKHGFVSLWDGEVYRPKCKKLIVIGSSFGGPAALLVSRHSMVDKVIIVSGVVDWPDVENGNENYAFTIKFFPQAFGNGYRVVKDGWKKLYGGKFYNPTSERQLIDPKKVVFIHAKDDPTVPYPNVKAFANSLEAPIIEARKGGHLGTKYIYRKKVFDYLRKKKYL